MDRRLVEQGFVQRTNLSAPPPDAIVAFGHGGREAERTPRDITSQQRPTGAGARRTAAATARRETGIAPSVETGRSDLASKVRRGASRAARLHQHGTITGTERRP
ncbi:hypothetical protein ACLF3G_03775 [Falsiroseomonas sp. HC035]|uniref:hypothetical protein n=1 Tax=Falsiroseomonas sp. HC035 TaxID=3390999 RepID=UPI003D31BC7D